MKIQVTFENCKDDSAIRHIFEKSMARLDKHMKPVPDESCFLHGKIERHDTKLRFQATLALNVPGRTLVAKEEGVDGESVVREAFLELERQIKKYKEFRRAEPLWRRKARREGLRKQTKKAPGLPGDREKEILWEMVMPHLDEMYNFIRRELAHFWASGDIIRSGEIQLQDIMDRVVDRAIREFQKKPSRINMRVWLLKIAFEEIAVEVNRVKRERELFVSIEKDVPEVPPNEELKTLGDWIYEFYQPDEDLRLEDLVPDPKTISPEDIADNRDIQRFVNQSLAKLPESWREAFVLYYVEDFTVPEVAHITGQSEAEVRQSINHAREFLRQTMVRTLSEAETHNSWPAGKVSAQATTSNSQ